MDSSRHRATQPFLAQEDRSVPDGDGGCSGYVKRRRFMRLAGQSGVLGMMGTSWLAPLGKAIAQSASETKRPDRKRGKGCVMARSIITLWMDGGPSQLDTFDPHPNRAIAAGVGAIDTSVRGVQLAETMPQLATQMQSVALLRNMVTREGDHQRAQYNLRTGFQPTPALIHPTIGAVICHQLPNQSIEIPRHISILPGAIRSRGGFLGDTLDAFLTGDPRDPLPDMSLRVSKERLERRLENIDVIDRGFGQDQVDQIEQQTLHRTTMERALCMMESEQRAALDVTREPQSTQDAFGDSPFGRACLAAVRLAAIGVPCIEVNLSGWDSHVNNRGLQAGRCAILDPAMASLIAELRARDLLDRTLVVCAGEFGRTPHVTPATEGREHWPHGFSVAIAGGPVQGGTVIGATDPEGARIPYAEGTPIEDLHATILHAFGMDPETMLESPDGRPIRLSEGKPILGLLG